MINKEWLIIKDTIIIIISLFIGNLIMGCLRKSVLDDLKNQDIDE